MAITGSLPSGCGPEPVGLAKRSEAGTSPSTVVGTPFPPESQSGAVPRIRCGSFTRGSLPQPIFTNVPPGAQASL